MINATNVTVNPAFSSLPFNIWHKNKPNEPELSFPTKVAIAAISIVIVAICYSIQLTKIQIFDIIMPEEMII